MAARESHRYYHNKSKTEGHPRPLLANFDARGTFKSNVRSNGRYLQADEPDMFERGDLLSMGSTQKKNVLPQLGATRLRGVVVPRLPLNNPEGVRGIDRALINSIAMSKSLAKKEGKTSP